MSSSEFLVALGAEKPKIGQQMLTVGETLITGESDFTAAIGKPTALEADLLRIASAVFAADRAVRRGEGEDFTRDFVLDIPVVHIGRLLPLKTKIEELLYRLSQDAWVVKLRQVAGDLADIVVSKKSSGKTLLFSGGADSLAAAVEFGDKPLQLVSHKTKNTKVDLAQRALVEHLAKGGMDLPHTQVFVSSRDGGPTALKHAEEDSQRTRSFVFLVIGALVARRTAHHDLVYLAENGQMAVHLQLTHGRIGALSTHTAHPDVLATMQHFLSDVFDSPLTITNPYVYMTKGEVVATLCKKWPAALWASNSCWRAARLSGSATHCGECVPCFIRRIAIETHRSDQSSYARDPWAEKLSMARPDDVARRNLADIAEFVVRFRRDSEEEIRSEWPELFSPNMDASKVILMYRRFASEAQTVLNRYPHMLAFLS